MPAHAAIEAEEFTPRSSVAASWRAFALLTKTYLEVAKPDMCFFAIHFPICAVGACSRRVFKRFANLKGKTRTHLIPQEPPPSIWLAMFWHYKNELVQGFVTTRFPVVPAALSRKDASLGSRAVALPFMSSLSFDDYPLHRSWKLGFPESVWKSRREALS